MESQTGAPDADYKYDFDSGNLSLDLANSLEWHASDNPVEHMPDYVSLISWGEAAGILTEERAAQLRNLAMQTPDEATEAYGRAITLREVVFRIFSHVYHQEEIKAGDMQALNALLSQSLLHLELVSSGEGFDWIWSGDSQDFDQIIWPVARQAAELLTSDQLNRVRVCEDDRGCGYLFIDTTRNHSRRWCSMESCGNRAKARRHYARQRNTL
jgi:predicted RNA-binding Zn ribbon-like protein